MSKNKIKKSFLGLLLLIGVFIYNNYLEEPINKVFKEIDSTYNEKDDYNARYVDGNLSVEYIDVGQADCILISNNNQYMLIDAGNNEDGEKLVTYFNSLGITKFDYVVGTHAHEDHIGGIDDIIDNFDIETFYMPDVVTTTKTFEDVIVSLENKQLAFSTPKIGSTFNLDDAEVRVLYVGEDESDLNDTSIILKMTHGSNDFLFMADASTKVEKEILNNNIDAEVLKVGHHGSQYSSSLNFLKKVNPKLAIIPTETGNIYGHPRKEILDRLDDLNIKVYRTDLDGTIVVSSDGEKLDVSLKETDTNGN